MKELMFQDNSLRLVERDGQVWVGAADIARALGYARADKVTRIYDRHSGEFSVSMSTMAMLPDLDPQTGVPGQSRLNRLFSLRGAHLVAMFARTAKGQEFRRWLLDLIESHRELTPSHVSLMQQYYDAKASLEAQNKFASACGKGLSDHKKARTPLIDRVHQIAASLQPSLIAA